MSDSEEDLVGFASDSDQNSDVELQKAFKEGRLTGLSYETKEKRRSINNKVGLKKALDELKNKLPWLERLDLMVEPIRPPKVLADQLGEDPDDLSGNEVHNDFKREMKFYRQAQAAVLEGLPRLHSLGVPTRRPNDYLAEMVKSDAHMDKVRQKLLSIKEGQERSEKAKKLREMRKFGKKIQQEVIGQRQKEKKEMMNAVKAFKKGKLNSLDFLEDKPNKKPNNSQSNPSQSTKQQKGNFQQSKKRELKDKKFGFGGQKKRSKHNTSQSVNDIGSEPRFSTGPKGARGKNKNKGGSKKRPGKLNRQKSKNRQGGKR